MEKHNCINWNAVSICWNFAKNQEPEKGISTHRFNGAIPQAINPRVSWEDEFWTNELTMNSGQIEM